VKVRQEDVPDLEVVLGRGRQVLLDVPLRIDHGRGPRSLVSDEIRCVREAAQIELFEDHVAIIAVVPKRPAVLLA